jgi:cytochrome c-type biogenesis protein
MGLALLGVLRASPLARERRLVTRLPSPSLGPVRPFVVGVAFGAAWSPCVGPLLAAALTVAARSGEVGRGTVLLLAYALGIGVPFVLVALSLASSPGLTRRLQRVGAVLERVAGALLVVLGLLLATGAYAHLTSYLARLTPSIGGL